MTKPKKNRENQAVRINGGHWRGRKLRFVERSDVRPTGDRIKETLFNWLAPGIEGARCLDLFAGSGALGFEALSRGAREVVFVEKDRRLVRSLADNLQMLECSRAQINCADSMVWLEQPDEAYEIVFLDPPFADKATAKLCKLLVQHKRLKTGSQVYVEMDARDPVWEPSSGFKWRRVKEAGQVRYGLLEYRQSASAGQE